VIDAGNNSGEYWHCWRRRWRCSEVEARRGLQLAWMMEEEDVMWMTKEKCCRCASHN